MEIMAQREWKLRRLLKQQERAELVKLWNEGLISGPSRFDSIDAVKTEARRRLEAGLGTAPV